MSPFQFFRQSLFAVTLITVSAFGAASFVQAQTLNKVTEVEGIAEYRLTNGMQVLFLADPAKAITTVNLTILAGSHHENYGETGMAHLLEHLIFKGSKNYADPKAEMIRRGLRWNGTTAEGRTNYYGTFAASDDTLNWYLGWLSDALVNSRIDKKDLDSEMTVVRNEFERGENNAEYMLLEKMRSVAFQWHNYGKSPIGARSDIEHVNIEHLRDFYRRYYQPDNAVLIVTGSFDLNKTLAQVQATFGQITKPTRQLDPHYTLDASQDGERQVTVRRNGDIPMVAALYHTMPAAHPDSAAMALLASIFGEEPEGRIYQALSEKKLATSTLGWAISKREAGAVLFGARLGKEMSVDAARKELLKVLDAIATEPITQKEFDQAKLRWQSQFAQMLADPVNISSGLSEAAASGDWRLLFLQRDRIEKVSLEDVRRVARQWLVPDNRTVGVYIPTVQPVRAPEPAFADANKELEGYTGKQAIATTTVFDADLSKLNDKIQQLKLDNGMQVALLPKEARSNKVSVIFTMRYGTEQSLAPQRAVPMLTLGMLDKGTQDLSRVGLVFKIMSLGLSGLQVNTGDNFFTISLQASGDKIKETIPFMLKMLQQPSFKEDEFQKLKAAQISRLERMRDDPDSMATIALDQIVNPYPADNIRSVHDFDTQIAEIKAVALQQVKAFHQQYFGASHAELVLVGAFDPLVAKAELNKSFGIWKSASPYTQIQYTHTPLEAKRIKLLAPDKKSATYIADLPIAINDDHPDFAVMIIADAALRKRLFYSVRDTKGLSYAVNSWLKFHSAGDDSHWRIYASFAPQNSDKVEAAISEELRKLGTTGFSQIEVKEAVEGVLERIKQNRSEDQTLARVIGQNMEKERDFSWYVNLEKQLRGLTNTEVNRVAGQYVKPLLWSKLLVGDFVKD